MNARIFIISLFISFSYMLSAQLISVQSALSSDTISIGEQLIYKFSVKSGESVDTEFPIFYDTISSNIEVLEMISIDTSFADKHRIISARYLVTSFEKGMNIIFPKPLKFSYGEMLDTAYSLPIVLTVIAPVVDTSQAIRPIKPPVNTPVSMKEVLPWVLIGYSGLLLLTLVIALVWIFIKRKKEPELFQMKPREPAHIVALRNLDKLKEEELSEHNMVKKYYSRLTEIIRTYISDQYGLQALESITEEILVEFKLVNRENNNLNDMLKELLELADLVKFAKEDPLRKENEQHLKNAYNFVHETYDLLVAENEEEVEEDNENDDETNMDITEDNINK